MTPDGPEPGQITDIVGDLLDCALAAHDKQEHPEQIRLWRRAVLAIAGVPDPSPATCVRLAEQLLEFGRRLRATVDPFFLAEITGQAARLARGDEHSGLYAHAASSHAGALAVIDDDLSLSWFQESIATYRALAIQHTAYCAELDQVLVNAGILHERAGRWALAVECVEEATAPSSGEALSPDRRAAALASALRCGVALERTEQARGFAARLRELLDLDSRAPTSGIRPRTRTSADKALASAEDAAHPTRQSQPTTNRRPR